MTNEESLDPNGTNVPAQDEGDENPDDLVGEEVEDDLGIDPSGFDDEDLEDTGDSDDQDNDPDNPEVDDSDVPATEGEDDE